ncbi:hypothetical protein GCM10023176_43000 [Micromonospora coerulea]|uniref:Uncharacterized protein n=1 Tax=Micromonospora coerulea TaxID=47856 RepID=A0ABP8SW59_9ACTN
MEEDDRARLADFVASRTPALMRVTPPVDARPASVTTLTAPPARSRDLPGGWTGARAPSAPRRRAGPRRVRHGGVRIPPATAATSEAVSVAWSWTSNGATGPWTVETSGSTAGSTPA